MFLESYRHRVRASVAPAHITLHAHTLLCRCAFNLRVELL